MFHAQKWNQEVCTEFNKHEVKAQVYEEMIKASSLGTSHCYVFYKRWQYHIGSALKVTFTPGSKG